jgi:hypothetical protein
MGEAVFCLYEYQPMVHLVGFNVNRHPASTVRANSRGIPYLQGLSLKFSARTLGEYPIESRQAVAFLTQEG